MSDKKQKFRVIRNFSDGRKEGVLISFTKGEVIYIDPETALRYNHVQAIEPYVEIVKPSKKLGKSKVETR